MADLSDINPALTVQGMNAFRKTTQLSLRNLSLGSPTAVITDANIAGLESVITSNGIQTSPQDMKLWLNSSAEEIRSNLHIKSIDDAFLKELAVSNPALVEFSLNAAEESPVDPTQVPNLRICRLTVIDMKGRAVSRGKGVFMTNSMVLTCRHVLGDLQSGSRVDVEVPHFHGPGMLADVDIWSSVRFSAAISQDKPILLAESPGRDEQEEISPFNDEQDENGLNAFLDYCIVEVEQGRQNWTIRADGERQSMMEVNATFVLHKLPNQLPKIKKPATAYFAGELVNRMVSIHSLSDNLERQMMHGGNVVEASETRQRIRYGNDDIDVERGDSGSPVTNEAAEIIGIHNAHTGTHGQAVPIGPIIEDIRAKAPALIPLLLPNFPIADV